MNTPSSFILENTLRLQYITLVPLIVSGVPEIPSTPVTRTDTSPQTGVAAGCDNELPITTKQHRATVSKGYDHFLSFLSLPNQVCEPTVSVLGQKSSGSPSSVSRRGVRDRLIDFKRDLLSVYREKEGPAFRRGLAAWTERGGVYGLE